jgi:nucleoside-diphosphate-sugar epimerase
MKILITGTAGFIGFHLAQRLIERGDVVVGIDNINDYYDINLKYARLAETGISQGCRKLAHPSTKHQVPQLQLCAHEPRRPTQTLNILTFNLLTISLSLSAENKNNTLF